MTTPSQPPEDRVTRLTFQNGHLVASSALWRLRRAGAPLRPGLTQRAAEWRLRAWRRAHA